MSFWGNDEGETFWGIGGTVAGALWLYINRDVPIIGGLGRIIDTQATSLESALRNIEGAFDLATAGGANLEILGALVGLPRNDLDDDDRYRRAIGVQLRLVLSSVGTRQSLIDIFSQWADSPALEYRNIPPNEFEISGTLAREDEPLMRTFIDLASPGGRIAGLYYMESDYLLGDYTTSAITSPGTTDYAQDPIAGAALTAGRIL